MVAGPEVSHLVSLYETEVQTKEAQEQTVHHEQTLQAQKTFLERVKKLSNFLQDLGNPFEEESRDLYSIDTRDIANPSSAELLETHLKKGQTKAQDFAQGLHCKRIQPLSMIQSREIESTSSAKKPLLLCNQSRSW